MRVTLSENLIFQPETSAAIRPVPFVSVPTAGMGTPARRPKRFLMESMEKDR
jgi:hypothetical protein